MTTTAYPRRRQSAHAAARAAKERREKVVVGAGVALLVVLLAIEVPKTLHLVSGGSAPARTTSAPAPTPAKPTTASEKAKATALHAALRATPHDLFAKSTTKPGPATLGNVSAPHGLHDPFAPTRVTGSAGHAATATTTGTKATGAKKKTAAFPGARPGRLVVGTPGPHRVAVSHWVVVLASIPASQGKHAATAFAAGARRQGVSPVEIVALHGRTKSQRAWVVFAGPYASQGEVGRRAGAVRAHGFTTAYVGKLTVYEPAKKAR